MAINVTYNDNYYLRDVWGKSVVGGGGISETVDDNYYLRDSIVPSIAGGVTDGIVRYYEDDYYLRDSIVHYLSDPGGGIEVIVTDNYYLRDSYLRDVVPGTIVVIVTDNYYLSDEIARTTEQTIDTRVNKNISFGDTKESTYKEYSHRFRWTDYNGIAVPDLNYKDLKEPIVRMMPAPSFLQFEYANSFLLFTRNSINRFVLKADVDTGQWRAQTDNLIEEFKDLGLMAPKTLVLAGDTLFGLSEKGVWKWNKNGMNLISDKIMDLPDAGIYEYIAFYCPIRNQYILHRQETSGILYLMDYGTVINYAGALTSISSEAQIKYLDNDKTITVGWTALGATGLFAFAMIGIIDRTTKAVTHGTQISLKPIDGLGGRGQPSVCKLDTDKVIVGVDDSLTGDLYVYVGTISGSSISLGTPTQIPAITGNATTFRLEKLNASTFVAFYGTDEAASGFNYRIGTVNGTNITFGVKQILISGSYVHPLKTAIVDTNKIAIMYRKIGDVSYVAVAEYVSGDTLSFGTHQSLGVLTEALAICAPHEEKLFMIYGTGTDMKLIPAAISGVEITLGNVSTYAGIYQSTYPDIGIASRSANGFYLFYMDLAVSNKGTVVYGVGSELSMQLYEETKTLFSTTTVTAINSATLENGLVICNYALGASYDGHEQIWGVEFANINSFVYQIDKDQWYKFLGIDIIDVPVILSGGSLDENYNLWLNSDRELQKYPGTISTTVEAYIVTKQFYIQEGVFQRWLVDFEGTNVNVETTVFKEVNGSEVEETDIKLSVAPNKFRGLSLGKMRGRKMEIKIVNAEILKGLSLDIKKWGER